jgi:flagellum-specific peptidoglycan hydrolase FlgJ
MDVTAARRASSAAQALLQETDKSLFIDGKFGNYTKRVFDRSPIQLQSTIQTLVKSLGFPAGVESLYAQYTSIKASPVGDQSSVFDLQVVPAIVREAKKRSLDASFALAQLVLESNWGKSTPRGDDGKLSYNYAGLKWNSVSPRTARQATAKSGEFIGGRKVTEISVFAAFDTPAEFAAAYFTYLYNGPSSYRYGGLEKASSAKAFGDILQKGGYATDPQYGSKLAAIANSVKRRYALA